MIGTGIEYDHLVGDSNDLYRLVSGVIVKEVGDRLVEKGKITHGELEGMRDQAFNDKGIRELGNARVMPTIVLLAWCEATVIEKLILTEKVIEDEINQLV